MCEVCVKGKEAEAIVARLTRDGVILTAEEQQKLNQAREDCEAFRSHKATVIAQRNLFKQHVRRCILSSKWLTLRLRAKNCDQEK